MRADRESVGARHDLAPSRRLPATYKAWLAGIWVSQLGDGALFFALGWAASAVGGSATGLVLTAVVLPRTVLLLLGGVVGDRAGARRVLIVGDAVMLVVAVALAVVSSGRRVPPLLLLVAAGLAIGTVSAFYLPSSGSMPRRLVHDEQLSRAVAVRQSGSQLVQMIGAPVGGAVVGFAGFAAAAWVDAVSFALVLIVLIAVAPVSAVAAAQSESVLRSAIDGFRVVARTPGLGSALLLVAGAAGLIVPSSSLLMPLLARHQGWGAGTTGLLVGAQGAGIIGATLVVARRGACRRPGIAAAAGLGGAAAGELILSMVSWPSLAGAAAFLLGAGSGTFVSNLAPVLLSAAPRTHLARVQALIGVVQAGALLATTNGLGAVAHLWSAAAAFRCCAVGVTVCALCAVGTPALRAIGTTGGPQRSGAG